MNRMDVVSRLETLGLSRNEARVYGALLRYKSAKVSDLVRLVRIQRPNLYTALARLVRQGYITAGQGRVKVFSACSPDTVFSARIEKTHRLYHEQQEAIKGLQQVYRKRKGNHYSSPFIEVRLAASDEPSVGYWERIAQIGKAKKELMFVRGRHPKVMTPARLEVARARVDEAELAALSRGIRCRSLLLASALADPGERKHARTLIKAGEEARVATRVSSAFLVIDRTIAWFRPADIEDRNVVYRVNDAFVGEVFARAFESYWAEGEDASVFLSRLERTGDSHKLETKKSGTEPHKQQEE